MTNEEFDRRFERHVEWSLQQQARFDARQVQFDADMDELRAGLAETRKLVDRTAETVSSLTAVTFEGFKVLSDAQRVTEEQLQKLMAKFDRNSSEDHNGLQN
jgi:hypothetical protein